MNRLNERYSLSYSLLSISFFLLICGCNLGPQYVEPELPLPTEWKISSSIPLNQSSLDSFVWWKSLGDPLLNAFMEKAACQNLDLHMAMLRIFESRLMEKGGKSAFLPSIDGSISYSYLNYDRNALSKLLGVNECCTKGGQSNLNVFEVGFDAQWELDFFGMKMHEYRSLKAMTQASHEQFADIWVTLSAEIGKHYIELRGYQEQLCLIHRQIDVLKDTYALTESLVDGGFSGSLDLLLIEQELNMLKAQQPEIELLVRKHIDHLSVLLGGWPGDLFCELSVNDKVPTVPLCDPVGIPSELLRRRPDIRKAEKELEAATENIGVAVAALFPRISLTGFIGEIVGLNRAASWVGFAGPQILAPIFNSKMLKHDVCLSKIKREQAYLMYKKTVILAFEEAELSIAAFLHHLERHQLLNEVKNSTEHAYTSVMDLYQRGLKNFLEVDSAYRTFLDAEKALLQSRVDLLITYISLYKSLGGGWEIFIDQ